MSQHYLMILRDRSTSEITAMMRDAHVPGLSVAVVRSDRVLLAEAYGWADLARQVPAAVTTSYLWFSMSKIATATAAMRLVDEGRLDLDAPVSEYVAGLRRPTGPQPTMRHLLTHTSGLGNPVPIRWVHPADEAGPDQDVMLHRLLRRRAFRHATGGRAHYSNVGYLAAGQVVAAVAGIPFQRYLVDAVLRPAGMTATGLTYGADRPRATGYVRAPRLADPLLRLMLPRGVLGGRHGSYRALRPFLVDGAGYGGLVGDVADAARLVRLHLGDGAIDGTRILSGPTARAMRRVVASGPAYQHAIGWFRRPTGDDEPYLEHFGAGAGFWNVMRIYPERDLGMVIMTNSTSTYRFDPLFAYLAGREWGPAT
jgi:CubicO group peptidase (beta-lactamase class C family)